MTKNEATVVQTDAVIFPMEFAHDNRETITAEEQSAKPDSEKQSVKVNLENRFARLKKSLRKRSVSIL